MPRLLRLPIVFAVTFGLVAAVWSLFIPRIESAILSALIVAAITFVVALAFILILVKLFGVDLSGSVTPHANASFALDLPVDQALERAAEAVVAMRGQITEREPRAGHLVASLPISLRSWGEQIQLEVTAEGNGSFVRVASRPNGLSLEDWGKGEANVRAIAQALGAYPDRVEVEFGDPSAVPLHRQVAQRVRTAGTLAWAGAAVAVAMLIGIFLPFVSWDGVSLSLMDIGDVAGGTNWLLILMLVVAGGALLCFLTDDLPGLLPLGAIYLVYPAYVFGRAGEYLGEGTPAAVALSPMPGEPAAIGYNVVLLAGYAAIVLGLVDWFGGRARRRRAHA